MKTNRFSPVFPELRQQAIDEAHAALLSTPTQTDPSNSKAIAKRRQTAHGRLEGSDEQDIYAFDVSDDGDFQLGSESKKRKRPSPKNKAGRVKKNDDGDGYKEGTGSSRKKPIRRAKSTGGGEVLDLLDNTSEDDWRPNTSRPPTSGRKSTRGNTVGTDLLPPLPKSKRKPRELGKTTPHHDPQQFDGDLSLGFSHSDPSTTRSAEVQVAATESTSHTIASTFVIDLTDDTLVLQNERRAEYDALSPDLSTVESLQEFSVPNPGGVYNTPDLHSTIPDPPYDPNLPLSQIAAHIAAYSHVPEPHPLAPPSIASDSPLSSLENTPAKPAKKKPMRGKRAATDQHIGLGPSPDGDHGFGSFSIASEWRAAKGKARQGMAQATYAGRAKTSNAIDLFAAGNGGGSEVDDIWTGDGKAATKKRKPAVKKRKSTANDDDLELETGVQKAKPKRRKSKAIETPAIGNTEDELSGGSGKGYLNPHAIIQVAATASAESVPNSEVGVRLNANQRGKNPEDELHGVITVSNPPHNGIYDNKQLVFEEYRPPGHEIGVKKVHRGGHPTFLDEPIDGDSSSITLGVVGGPGATGKAATGQPAASDPFVFIERELELLSEPAKPTKKDTHAAKRRKSKKDESEEEDWTGDPEPTRKPAPKKETKAKTPRVTKKAAAAAAQEAKEKEKQQLLYETIKDPDNGDEDLPPTAIIADPEPAKQTPVPEPTKKGARKIPAAKEAKKKRVTKTIATSKETVSDTDDEEDGKKDISILVPEPKPEARKEEPQTPSKKLVEKVKKTPHSPINKGPVKFRVGLSRRAHIEPLLKIIRK